MVLFIGFKKICNLKVALVCPDDGINETHDGTVASRFRLSDKPGFQLRAPESRPRFRRREREHAIREVVVCNSALCIRLTRMHDENEGCVLMLCDVWEPKQMFLPGYAASKILCSLATITTSYACSGDIFTLYTRICGVYLGFDHGVTTFC
jgi:hypothetical protein